MSEVGDAVELTYTTTPGATVTVTWINRDTETVAIQDQPVPERLLEGEGTGQYPVTLAGDSVGFWEARFTASGPVAAVESYFERFESLAGQAPPYATLTEYTDLYGTLSDARAATARALLRRASKLVRDSNPGLDAKIVAGTASRDTVGLAVLNMVARVLRNPAGLRSETTGPFSRAYDPESASGMLEISSGDSALLDSATPGSGAGSGRRKYRTVRVNGGMVPPSSRPGRRWPRGGLI